MAADLGDAWEPGLLAAGFSPTQPALFFIEGLLPYLKPDQALGLLAQVSDIASPSSKLVLDIVGESFLESPWTAAHLQRLRELGAPWQFGSDEPERLLETLGWQATATMPGEPDAHWGRWPYPVAPRSQAQFPKTYLVRAIRGG